MQDWLEGWAGDYEGWDFSASHVEVEEYMGEWVARAWCDDWQVFPPINEDVLNAAVSELRRIV